MPNLKIVENGSPHQFDNMGGPPDDPGMDHERRLTAIETLMPTLMTKTDGEVLRSDLHKMDATIKTWMLATVLAIIGAMLAAIFGVATVFKNSGPAAAPAPIIIQIPAATPVQIPAAK